MDILYESMVLFPRIKYVTSRTEKLGDEVVVGSEVVALDDDEADSSPVTTAAPTNAGS
jgi:hypothetical protein